ncbi:MAG: CehA/McbA family metallohydrolase [Anaerolineae bacterium]
MARQKLLGLLLILAGVFSLTSLLISLSGQPALATGSTPTPALPNPTAEPGGPDDALCHLAAGQDCSFINTLDKALMEAAVERRMYPTLGAQAVPTYTLISAAFGRAMQAGSFTPATFMVTQAGSQPVAGTVSYIAESQIAVFSPQAPLQPNTVYTATLSPEVRDIYGAPLGESWVWSFTTARANTALTPDIAAAEVSAQGMNIYFGDLHSHTSYSDGAGTPAQAFATARANGLDFMALSEHCFMMSPAEWADVKTQANLATINGQFVALPAFEYSHQYGHINVFESETYVRSDDPNYDTLPEFYNWLIAQPLAFAQFNHPRKEPGLDWNFNDFAFNSQADLKIILQELQTADQFFLALNTGWHLGTLKNRDTHAPNWGINPWMGLIAPSLTKDSIVEALRKRRTFFVSPSDSNLALVLQANGAWMGSAIPFNTGAINFTINAYDPDPKGKPLRINLYENGVRIATTLLPGSTVYTWQPVVAAKLGRYYYAEAYYSGWLYPAYSSPIWVEQPPLAEAGPTQFVAPGQMVTLDGRASYDPDSDALAYQWAQESGPGVGLANSNTAQPSLIAPSTLGEMTFHLHVTDPGLLTAADTVAINVTDAPILAISKSGPAKAEPGQPITYILTVANHGASPATQVTVTDALPVGASYVSGGTLLPGNIVAWTIPTLAAYGGTAQVSFSVTANQPIANRAYGATCAGCIAAEGSVAVYTNWGQLYLPVLPKN